MKSFRPPRPVGYDAQTTFNKAVWDSIWGGQNEPQSTSTVKVVKVPRGYRFHAKPGVSGGTPNNKPVWL